jgi:hypothetical protein
MAYAQRSHFTNSLVNNLKTKYIKIFICWKTIAMVATWSMGVILSKSLGGNAQKLKKYCYKELV